jgi:hypothetical protein
LRDNTWVAFEREGRKTRKVEIKFRLITPTPHYALVGCYWTGVAVSTRAGTRRFLGALWVNRAYVSAS